MVQTNLIGKNILGYTVSEKLGSGAFGTVYKVIKTNTPDQYVRALKHIIIPTEKQYNFALNSMGGNVFKADSYFSQMLNNIVSEIRILNDLSEKGVQHIVRYYENDILVTNSPRRYDIFILMEYLTPLENFIKSGDFLVRDVGKLGLDVLSGLQSYHDNGVIHRDIKDNNIFVSDKGEYKIGGFGISKVLKDRSKAEVLKGTFNFLAPEVYLGEEDYTKSVDLYSLGIILYRLLNYGRNPFLPLFPKKIFSQDEYAAFEERMHGKTPELPAFGGEKIGRVIVKAISNSSERFQSADEFINALEVAINNTSSEILTKKVKFLTSDYAEFIKGSKAKQYSFTMGETAPQSASEHYVDLRQKHNQESFSGAIHPNINRPVVSIVPDISKLRESVVLDKKVMNKFVFLIPVVILLIGVAVYFIAIPDTYGRVISFDDLLFTDPQSIIDTLCASNVASPKNNSIIGMQFFWRVWLAGLITSLFFVGKQLQAKPEPNAVNAILKKKEPYLMVQDVTNALKQLKTRGINKQLDSLIHEVKKLEEKLSIESDFGYGKNAVIDCENNVAQQIQFLLDIVPCIENENLEENLMAMNTAVMNINSLLRRRTELKKR